MNHATPWTAKDHIVYASTGQAVAECWLRGGTVGQDNAAYIVRCVNAHDELVAALARISLYANDHGSPSVVIVKEMAKIANAALDKVRA